MKKEPLKTALVGGQTIKTDERIKFFGEVDCLSSYIMELTHYCDDVEIKEELKTIVKKLSQIMGIVAGCSLPFGDEELGWLLDLIKKYKTSSPILTEFVLPGQTLLSAKTHIVRTITRKSELAYAVVFEKYGGNDFVFEYLNKLSTFFYELALYFEKNK